MEGGRIAGNTLLLRAGGGGVYVGPESVFEMRGGTISGNLVKGNGGGVYVDTDGTFNMSGGRIAGNAAGGLGGGVYIEAGGKFFKTEGTICGDDDEDNQNTMGAEPKGNALYIMPSRPINDTLSDSFTL
jgi:hypothetical protein